MPRKRHRHFGSCDTTKSKCLFRNDDEKAQINCFKLNVIKNCIH